MKSLTIRICHLKLPLIVLLILLPNMLIAQNKNIKETISIDEMILKKKNKPKQKKLLLKFKIDYDKDDRIVVEEFRNYFKITVDHLGSNGSTGGAECYKVDKKTGERKMLWHEHPMDIPELKEDGNDN